MTRPSDDRIRPSPTGSRTAGPPANAGKIPPEAEAAWVGEIERRVDGARARTFVTYAREDVPAGMENAGRMDRIRMHAAARPGTLRGRGLVR